MKAKYHSLYRFAASFAVLCAVYPPAAMTCRLLGYGAGVCVTAALVNLAVGLLGYGFHRLLERGLFSRAVQGMLTGLAGLLPAGGICWALWGGPWYQTMIAGLAALLLFCVGAILAGREYHEILPESAFHVLTAFYVVVSVAAWALYAETPIWITVLFYLVLVVVYGLLRNQSNIERLTISRHFTLDYLPNKIRSYNLALLVIILAVILLFFVVAVIAAGPFDRAMNVLRDYVNTSMHGQAGGTDQIDDPLMPIGEGREADEVVADTPSAFALLVAQSIRMMIYAGIIGVFVAIFLFNRDAILAFFYRIYQRIVAMGRGLRAKPVPARQLEEDVPDYVDVVQTVSATEEDPRSEEDEFREWRRAYRRYTRMEDNDEKYRTGYTLARKGLALSGLEVRPSDTTLEVAGKSELVLEDDRYGRATTLYNVITYGPEEYTPGNLRALDETLVELKGLGKRRGKRRGKKREVTPAEAPQAQSPAALARRQAMGDLYREPPKDRKITPLMIVLIVIAAVLVMFFIVSFVMSYKQSHPWLFH